MSDSIIQEVRDIREQHTASMGYDLDRIYIDLQARQEKHAAEGWVIVPPPSSPPPEPRSAWKQVPGGMYAQIYDDDRELQELTAAASLDRPAGPRYVAAWSALKVDSWKNFTNA